MVAKKKAEFAGRISKGLKLKRTRRRLVRYGLLALNAAILVTVVVFVFAGSHTASTSANDLVSSNNAATIDKPVDQLTSYDIASNIAQITDMPEQTAIANQAQSAKIAFYTSSNSAGLSTKPQVVTTALKSRKDIHSYRVQAGDTISSIAQKFGVTSDSILWSNGLTGNWVNTGKVLVIPPVNGIVYTVKSGDTPKSLAQKYNASTQEIIAYNDAELHGLKPGEKIIIPNGSEVVSHGWGGSNFIPRYGNNGYDPGWCTWYVASMIKVPNNWGDAKTWAFFARLSGWTVSSAPKVGAIAQTPYGWGGHVAIVSAVRGNMIKYSDMNGIAGFDQVGYSHWVSASHFPNYIYH